MSSRSFWTGVFQAINCTGTNNPAQNYRDNIHPIQTKITRKRKQTTWT